MRTISLTVIAICCMANTFAVYRAEDGGTNVFLGNFGYHIEGATE
jgi:hypothetical protein